MSTGFKARYGKWGEHGPTDSDESKNSNTTTTPKDSKREIVTGIVPDTNGVKYFSFKSQYERKKRDGNTAPGAGPSGA